MVVALVCVTFTRATSGSESVLTAHRSSSHDRPATRERLGVVGDESDPPHAAQDGARRIALLYGTLSTPGEV
jgi:hypothetical protein